MQKQLFSLLFLLFVAQINYAQEWEPVGPDDFNAPASTESRFLGTANGPNNSIYSAYVDYESSGKISVKQFINDEWVYVGSPSFSGQYADRLTITSDKNYTPYIIFSDNDHGRKTTVMRFQNDAWEVVGSAGFSANSSYDNAIAVNDEGSIYVAVRDADNSSKHTVYHYVNEAWEVVGVSGISENNTNTMHLKLDSNSIPYVAYTEYDSNTGTTTGSVKRFSNNTWEYVGTPSFTGPTYSNMSFDLDSNNTPYVLFNNNSNSTLSVVKYINDTWEPVGTNTITEYNTSYFAISVNENNDPVVVFQNQQSKITVRQLVNETWETVGAEDFISDNVYVYGQPNITITNDTIYTSLQGDDFMMGHSTPTVYQYSNDEWSTAGENTGIGQGHLYKNALAIDSNSIPYVAFANRNNDYKASVLRFEDEHWVPVGNQGFSAASASQITMAMDSNDIPYVFYMDGSADDKGTVQRFINNQWEVVGQIGFTATNGYNPSIKIDPNGVPHIIYYYSGGNYTMEIMKFTDSGWVKVDTSSLIGQSSSYAMSFSNDATLYVAYSDKSNGGKETIKRLVNEGWEDVGSPSTAAGSVYIVNLEFDSNDVVYISYSDNGNNYSSAVKKLVDNTWEFVGLDGFSGNYAYDNSLTISPDNVPFIAYQDGASNSKLTVQSFKESNWEHTGTPAFSASRTQLLTIKAARNGSIYAAYNSYETFFVKKFTDNVVPVFTSEATVSIAENEIEVLDINATDIDGDAEGNGLSFSFTTHNNGGTDNDLFALEQNSGVLSFKNAPDFEAPLDEDHNNIYEVQVSVTDSQGGTTVQNLTVTITNINDLALDISAQNVLCFGSDAGSVTLQVSQGTPDYASELFLNGTRVGDAINHQEPSYTFEHLIAGDYTVKITDSKGDSATDVVTIRQPDNLNATAHITMESFLDANDAVIELTVAGGTTPYKYTWSNGESESNLLNLGMGLYTVTIEDANGCTLDQTFTVEQNSPPTILTSASIEKMENSLAVIDMEVSDSEGDIELNGIEFSLSTTNNGGIDNSLFSINTDLGIIEFIANPDFENPTDENSDNIYEIQVTIRDSYGATALQNITITITDDVEDNVEEEEEEEVVVVEETPVVEEEVEVPPTNTQPSLIPAEAFTPNGDGINDSWTIPGIENYPNNAVKVFNRSGNKVFETKGYQNNWVGFYKDNREKLPSGSYLYVIDFGNGTAPLQGWIFINY